MRKASEDPHEVCASQLLRALGWLQNNVALLTGAGAGRGEALNPGGRPVS
ncbi:MAG TPA: hypothetical protein VIS76_05260 [Pseudomonadales bacterium]